MKSSKIFSSFALLLLGLFFVNIGSLKAQVDCSALSFAASNHQTILINMPTTTACQNPTFVTLVRKSGTGAPYAVHGSISYFDDNGREQAAIRDLDACSRYDIRVIVYCNNQFVGICSSQGVYATKGCEEPSCDGVMAYNISDNDAYISVAGFENCRVGNYLSFETQWREAGSSSWNSQNSQTTATYKHLTNLEHCTEYEYRIRVTCDGEQTDWCRGTFKTDGCPCDDCGISVNHIAIQNPAGCTKSFLVSTSMTGNCTIVSYDFDFGNGNSATSTTNPTNWVYTESGKYEVCVTVNAVNEKGDTCSVQYCDSIEVTECVDCDDCGLEIKNFNVLDLQSNPCTKIVVANSSADAPCSVTGYTFHWGDGTSSTSSFGIAGHTYPGDGVYPVCVTITADNGFGRTCTKSECKTIVVAGCGTKSVDKAEIKETLYAYPNPVSAGSEVTVVLPQGGAHLKLVDLSGRLVMAKTVTTGGGHRLNIPVELPAGIYLLRDEEGRFEPQKILVQ